MNHQVQLLPLIQKNNNSSCLDRSEGCSRQEFHKGPISIFQVQGYKVRHQFTSYLFQGVIDDIVREELIFFIYIIDKALDYLGYLHDLDFE